MELKFKGFTTRIARREDTLLVVLLPKSLMHHIPAAPGISVEGHIVSFDIGVFGREDPLSEVLNLIGAACNEAAIEFEELHLINGGTMPLLTEETKMRIDSRDSVYEIDLTAGLPAARIITK